MPERLKVSGQLKRFDLLRDLVDNLYRLGFFNVQISVPNVTILLPAIQIPEYERLLAKYWHKETGVYRFAELIITLKALDIAKKGKQWQYRPILNPGNWKNCTDEEYEQISHLARFEFQQIDI